LPFRDNHARWQDILDCLTLIRQFTEGMDFEAYQEDDKTKSAVERQLLILSEAAKMLVSLAEERCPDHDWKGFRGMGDVLRHAYHRVNDRLIWDTVTTELPPLKQCVESVLRDGNESVNPHPSPPK
jgi:uncharacterized protein with HEPN domain